MQIPCDETDRSLFAACSSITLGNGEKAVFWTDKWLNGESPQSLAPDLFRLTFRKKHTVKTAFQNGTWMRLLQQKTNGNELEQFISLREKIQGVRLRSSTDLVTW
jgi:hypothetical protein